MQQLFTALFIFFITAFSSPNEKELIEYNKRRVLTWEDYQAQPNPTSSFKALTTTRVSFKANSNGKLLQLSLKNTFEPHNSWTKSNESGSLLEHERLHFHISELYARKLRKEILETKFSVSDQKLMNEISRLYEEKMIELSKYHKQYDRETGHSTIEKKQNEWESKIKSELITLKRFANPTLEIELK
ncbi:MAG: hypothetical protein ACJASF_000922 [Vicingaceae bacterium]|jgi:hypothetical protein